MISKERVNGYWRWYDNTYLRFPIIPAIWCFGLAKSIIGSDDLWKEKLDSGDTIAENCELKNDRNDRRQDYFKLEESAIRDWERFEKDFLKLRNQSPARVRATIPQLVRAKQHCEKRGFLWYECFNGVYPQKGGFEDYNGNMLDISYGGGLIPVKVKNPETVLAVVRDNRALNNRILMRCGGLRVDWEYIPQFKIDEACLVNVESWWDWKALGIEEIAIPAETIENQEARIIVPSIVGSEIQVAPAPVFSLIRSDPTPADPAAVFADSIPSVKWEFAEIQGSVRDSKRETTLTVTKKANEILERMDEKLGRIAENTSSGNAKPKTRLETLRDLYLTHCKTVNQNAARYLMREKEKCEYEEIWKIEHWGEDWDAVDIEIKRQEIANIRAGVSQARPKQS